MTSSLRVLHRRAIFAVALAVPMIIAAGITARQPMPRANVFSIAGEDERDGIRTLFAADDLWRRTRIATRILIRPGDPGHRWIELEPLEEFGQADLLLYWSSARPRERLSPTSHLLGALRGRSPQRFAVPDTVNLREGYLILYDLPHAEIFGIAEVPTQL
jgi:hypothetical protein